MCLRLVDLVGLMILAGLLVWWEQLLYCELGLLSCYLDWLVIYFVDCFDCLCFEVCCGFAVVWVACWFCLVCFTLLGVLGFCFCFDFVGLFYLFVFCVVCCFVVLLGYF